VDEIQSLDEGLFGLDVKVAEDEDVDDETVLFLLVLCC